jgi:hypothetical protein
MKGKETLARFMRNFFHRATVLCLLALVLSSCAALPRPTPSARVGTKGALGSCADFFADLDRRAEKAQVLDAGSFRVRGYPYLRIDRLLASFRWQVQGDAAFGAWVDHMQELDRQARRFEIANLPPGELAAGNGPEARQNLDQRILSCGDLLKAADFKKTAHQEELRQRARAPDEYIELRRVLGLYPITGLVVSRRIANWHKEAHQRFSLNPPQERQTTRYAPPALADRSVAARIVARAERDALGLPRYSAEEKDALFKSYAPLWQVETRGPYDLIGSPLWNDKGSLDVDLSQPVTFTLMSFTRFGNEILTQLNYIIWFPSRPKEGAWDIYGGRLDGVNLRVTLDSNGEPLLYETMHNCGCYYKAYPSGRLRVRPSIDYAEPPLIFAAPRVDPARQVLAVAMESRTHYVLHLYPAALPAASGAATYRLMDYGTLRSLPFASKIKKSMFGQDSIVAGSDRLERFILWPMGVLSAGGMRQWGRHAVAFVGRRQFDDPFYMDKMFTR